MRHITLVRLSKLPITVGFVMSTATTTLAAEFDPKTEEHRKTRFGTKSEWVLDFDGLLSLRYTRTDDTKFSGLDPQGNPYEDSHHASTLTASAFTPSVGGDWFPIEHLSVGVGAAYLQSTTSSSNVATGPSGTTRSTDSWISRGALLMPRVGFAFGTDWGLGAWGRARLGPSLSAVEMPGGRSETATDLVSGLDLLATYVPAEHFVLFAGPWVTKRLAHLGGPSGLNIYDSTQPVLGVSLGMGVTL